MEPALEGWKLYKDFGVAALFITMYLVTIVMFIRVLMAQNAKYEALVERVIKVSEAQTASTDNNTQVLHSVNETLSEGARSTGEFIAFLKGRDRRED